MNRFLSLTLALALAAPAARAADFEAAAQTIQQDLTQSLQALTQLRDQIANEKIPLSKQLSAAENQLLDTRAEFERTSRLLDSRNLDLNNLRTERQARHEEKNYISNLLSEYLRNFESRIHISELQRYRRPIESARLATEQADLPAADVLAAQVAAVTVSLERLQEALGGAAFAGQAVGTDGRQRAGQFTVIGPVALFRAADGQGVGLAEQQLGSFEPAILPLTDPVLAKEVENIVTTGRGRLPFDPTLGNALKIAATRETLVEHFLKGGPVMWPILFLAVAAFGVGLARWVVLARVRTPAPQAVDSLLTAVERRDHSRARELAAKLPGPAGEMIQAGAAHLHEPAELVEEVMYERMLETKLKLQSWLPLVAMSASAAPLFGLLGTVTGMINTFKLITVFGSGDPKTLSSGISEALITTEYGLIVAIPSLLLYAFLSRKAKGQTDSLEKLAVAFMNRFAKSAPPPATPQTEPAEVATA